MPKSTTNSIAEPTSTVGLADVLSTLRKGAGIAILIAAISGISAFMLSSRQAPVYSATTTLVATRPPEGYSSLVVFTPPQVDPRVFQSALLEGNAIPSAMTRVDGISPTPSQIDDFKKALRVSIEAQLISGVVRIEVRSTSAERAAAYADALAEELIAWDRMRARSLVDGSISDLENSIATIDIQLSANASASQEADSQLRQVQLATQRDQLSRELEIMRARTTTSIAVSSIEQLRPALVPDKAIGPRIIFNTFVAVVVGLLLAYFAQLMMWAIQNTIGSRERLLQATGLPVLATLSKGRSRVRSHRVDAEFLRANVLRSFRGKTPLVIGIVGAQASRDGEGVAPLLAEGLAISGFSTLLIERGTGSVRPDAGPITMRSAQVPILESYLTGDISTIQSAGRAISSTASYEVIPSSSTPTVSSGVLERGLSPLLARLRQDFDIVLFELPPVLQRADAVTACSHMDGLVVCVDVNTNRDNVTTAIEALKFAGGSVIGTVLTGLRRKAGSKNQPSRASGFEPRGAAGGRSPESGTRAVARVRQRS